MHTSDIGLKWGVGRFRNPKLKVYFPSDRHFLSPLLPPFRWCNRVRCTQTRNFFPSSSFPDIEQPLPPVFHQRSPSPPPPSSFLPCFHPAPPISTVHPPREHCTQTNMSGGGGGGGGISFPFSLLPHETLEDAAASASVAVDPGGIDFGSNFARCVGGPHYTAEKVASLYFRSPQLPKTH